MPTDRLTPDEYAAAHDLSVDAVRRQLRRGDIPGEKERGRWVAIVESEHPSSHGRRRFRRVWKVLKPQRRKVIYAAVFVVTLAVILVGLISTDQLNEVIEGASGIVAALTALMAFLNTGSSDGSDDE